MVQWMVDLVVSTWLLAVLVEPVLVALMVDVVVDSKRTVLAEIAGVAPIVEDDGYESWIGCEAVDSAAHSVAEAR